MLWPRTEDWRVFLHERGGWVCADPLDAPLTATARNALEAWQSLAARMPKHARVSVWLSAGVAPVLRVKGEARLREADWSKLAVIQQFGAESSSHSVVALNQHDDPAVRIACVADSDLIQNITQGVLQIQQIASWPLALFKQWQDKSGHKNEPALIAVADQDAWVLAALDQDGCQALLSMPAQVPADQIEWELQRLAVSLAWTGVESHVLPCRLTEVSTNRFKKKSGSVFKLFFAKPASKVLRTALGVLLLFWIVSLAALLQAANTIQSLGKENQFRIQKIDSISSSSSSSADPVVSPESSDVKRDEWLSLLKDLQRVSAAAPEVLVVADFSFDESDRPGRAALRVPLEKKKDFDEMCLPMLEMQTWEVASMRNVVDPVYKKGFDVVVEYRNRVASGTH